MKITIESFPDDDSEDGFRYEVIDMATPEGEPYIVRDLTDLMSDIDDMYFGTEI